MNSVRYLNKDLSGQERNNYSGWWREQINHYGTKIRYYSSGYTLTSHNFIYGEDPTSAFQQVGEMIMLTNITNDSIMLSKFGIMADCDMTAVVHISAFSEALGCSTGGREPKSGDLIELHEYGGFGDRPGFRGAPIYEITERDDQNLDLTNTLMGHYVWYIKCKRWEYSYEPGVHSEPVNIQVNDGGDYGRLAGGENPEELRQPYPDSADNSASCIYDYYDGSVEECGPVAGHFIPTSDDCNSPENSFDIPLYPTIANMLAVPENSTLESTVNETLTASKYLASFIENHKDDILLRTLVQTNGNDKTFMLETCGKVEDDISYTTNLDVFELFSVDGGVIDTNNI